MPELNETYDLTERSANIFLELFVTKMIYFVLRMAIFLGLAINAFLRKCYMYHAITKPDGEEVP
jgi:hypothetical protein